MIFFRAFSVAGSDQNPYQATILTFFYALKKSLGEYLVWSGRDRAPRLDPWKNSSLEFLFWNQNMVIFFTFASLFLLQLLFVFFRLQPVLPLLWNGNMSHTLDHTKLNFFLFYESETHLCLIASRRLSNSAIPFSILARRSSSKDLYVEPPDDFDAAPEASSDGRFWGIGTPLNF